MNYQTLKLLTMIVPTVLIGGFEYIRHMFLISYLSMTTGNLYITILTFILSALFATWMFRLIEQMNEKINREQAKRAVYEERERLARELHDNIAQTLFLLNVKLKQGKLEESKSAVTEIDFQLRQAIFNLRSDPEEGGEFSIRINKWVHEWSVVTGVEVNEMGKQIDDLFSPQEEVQLFGIIQEAFTNIRKHADATEVTIRFDFTPDGWRLQIIDNGRGMVGNSEPNNHQYGLKMIRERAAKIGASIEMDNSSHNGGTRLMIESAGGKV
ncbi:MAG TPA: ATP-binding protein [Bacillota bacterium]|nr:ATP-binding protein [Bacillota bacterium]